MYNFENWKISPYEFRVELDGRVLSGDFQVHEKGGHRFCEIEGVFDETDKGAPVLVNDVDLFKAISKYIDETLSDSSYDYDEDQILARAERYE